MIRSDVLRSENEVLGYTLFTPENMEKGKRYPLILSLHGAGERGDGAGELDKATNIGIGKYIKQGMMELDAIVLCPQCPCDNVWSKLIPETKALTDRIVQSYPVDTDRISVTGMSMGGFGTWEMGMSYPHYFSAFAPICGGGMAWRADAFRNKPIWAFHGNADTVVDISNSADMVRGARRNGAIVKFTIFDDVQHNSWDPAYLDTRVIDWLLEQTL
ncbi:MAG: dienelactone hydrolase family protein [Clostridia bacterium]|nr:dienelactone hydrolase family protein [Clostridia bacterium]